MLPSPLVGEGRISTRGTSVRNSGEGWCKRHDNRQDIGGTCHVILNLFQDLAAVTQRKAPLPTLSPRGRGVVEPRQHIDLSCHCEVPKARHHVRQYSCDLPCHCEVPEVRHHVRQYSCDLPCHCEGERSEAVAIAKSLKLNEITTSCAHYS